MNEYLNGEVIQNFTKICEIPHGSGDTKELMQFLYKYAFECGFSVEADDAGNLHCIKGEPKICLQAHYDMVCVGDALKLDLCVMDGEFLVAKNSSLGADNGMGVAISMAMMKEFSDLEVLWTNDEEIGLLGANAFSGEIKSKFLLNLDTESDDEVIIGCAGDAKIEVRLQAEFAPCDDEMIEYSASGLRGGHSGVQIDENIANPLKDMARFAVQNGFKIVAFDGGECINSVPTSARLTVLAQNSNALDTFSKSASINFIGKSSTQHGASESRSAKRLDEKTTRYIANADKFLNFICAFSQGVRSYDKELGMVVSSINLSLVSTDEQGMRAEFFARAVDTQTLENLIFEMKTLANLAGLDINVGEISPAWAPEKSEFALAVADELAKHKEAVKITAVHAGLECGVLSARGQNLQACSIGPNIIAPHSVGEKCEIKSVAIIEQVVRNLIKKYN